MAKAILHRANCFPPVTARGARKLILGSSPGPESLAKSQYYAKPSNSFWKILGGLFGAPVDTYAQRLNIIKKSRLALWDVLAECERHGALDSRIIRKSKKANDFATFLKKNPKIRHIYFNGGTAEKDFVKLVMPDLPPSLVKSLKFTRLPSTSSAYAAMRPPQKAKAWSVIQR